MDNEVGVVDGAALHASVDGAAESKISHLPGSKGPDGDEVFEEAVEGSSDDGVQPLKEDSNDNVVTVTSNVQGVGESGLSRADDNLEQKHEDEAVIDAREEHLLEKNDANEAPVATVNDKGGTENEGALVDDERLTGYEDGAELLPISGHEAAVEAETSAVQEKGNTDFKGGEHLEEKPLQVPVPGGELKEGEAEEIDHSGADVNQFKASDESVACQDTDEMSRELPSKASPVSSSDDQNCTSEIHEEGWTVEREDSTHEEPKCATPASDAHRENGVSSVDSFDNGELHSGENGVEHITASSLSQQKEEEKELEDSAHGVSTSDESRLLTFEAEAPNPSDSTVSKNKEFETITSDPEREHGGSDQARAAQSHPDKIDNRGSSAEMGVKEEAPKKEIESRETEIKPAAATTLSTVKSANVVLPPVRPAGLGHVAPLSTSLGNRMPASEPEALNSSVSKGSSDKDNRTVGPGLEREHSSNDNMNNRGSSAKVGVKEENPDKVKQTRQTEIKPAAGAASSTTKSVNPVLPPARPAGLGRVAPLLEPAPRVVQQPRSNGAVSQVQSQLVEEVGNGESEEGDETREKLQMIRVKFLRLAHRLGQTPHNVVVAQVLYRLGLAEQLRGRTGGRSGGAFSYDRASAMAEQLEQTGKEPLDFSCTIMVLGKTGVGKSATINSIFDEVKFSTDAFDLGTKKVQDVEGTVQGIRVRIIDTPGLLSSWSDQRKNEKILHSVKQFIKKTPPDIVLYLDRLDMPSRDFRDMPLLRTITDVFGPSIWFNAIVVLTHAASAPPEGLNGTATTYDMFVTQRSHAVQQAIRQAAGDARLMNPVSLVENHSACRTNRAGQRVLPNGQVWKPHLLLLSFASKILAEANTLLKLQDTPMGKPVPARSRAPPLPFLLSSLLQSRPQLKLPDEQFGEDDTFDDDLDDSSDSEDESEYDELPPFRRLTKAQLAKLNKEQRKAYHDELDYRERLFMKKHLKEERKQRKMMKKMAEEAKDLPVDLGENVEEESNAAASVPVPMPDLALPASFDADNPTHRYRHLDNSNQWLVRPVLDAHGWDHDVGYEGINVERLFVVKDKVPVSFSGQVSKDKKEASVQMEVASSIKHGTGKATTLGLDMQSVGKDMAYTLRSETMFGNYKHNKATAGLSFTLLGDAMTAGFKVEDKLIANKRFRMVMSGGAMTGRGDVAYGGSLEATLRDKDYPLGRFVSSLGLSVMDWHGDLAIGCNMQSQIPVGRSTNLVARANLNNRGSGQVSLRLNSSEQMQLVLVGLIPLLKKVMGQYSSQQY